MDSHAHGDQPVVIICNTFEAYSGFINRFKREQLRTFYTHKFHSTSDRALFWIGATKLVIGSLPVFHLEEVKNRWNYHQTQYYYPKTYSDSLCHDICADPDLLKVLVEYAGKNKTLQLIPFANTSYFFQLVDFLRTQFQLTILLPESPSPDNLWLLNCIDQKLGYRTLISHWFNTTSDILPFGIPCTSLLQTVQAIQWFLQQHMSCIVKTNEGCLALGQEIFHPKTPYQFNEILAVLQENPFLVGDIFIVESFISSPQNLFPSAEFWVPSDPHQPPKLTYVCNQLFSPEGLFSGVLISPELPQQPWYSFLVEKGMAIATHLQALGFVGYFDLDALVSETGQVFLLEINARRTGATHVHEAACHLLGADYQTCYSLISQNSVSCSSLQNFDDLQQSLSELLYPIHAQKQGIVLTHSSNISQGEFGYIVIADSTKLAVELQQKLRESLKFFDSATS